MFKKYQKRAKIFPLNCDEDEMSFLKKEAKKRGMNVADMIRELIREKFFKDKKNKNGK